MHTKRKKVISSKYLWVLLIVGGILIPGSFILVKYLGTQINQASISELSQIDTGGDAVDVEVHYDIAYVSDMNANLLIIFDVSDPSHPVLLSTFQAHGNHQLTVVANGSQAICYLTDHNYGLYILNVSDPSNPQILSQYTDPGEIDDLVVIDDFAYVIDQEDGLEIVDISDPTDPQKLGDFSYGITGYHVDVLIQDEIAYLTDVQTGLTIVNVSDPTDMHEIAKYNHESQFHWMDLQSNYLFIPDQENIRVIDISDPTNPIIFATINDTGGHGVITVKNDLMYVSDFEEGLEVYDVSDLHNPEKLVTFFDGGIAFGHWVDYNLIFVADKTDNLEILELSLPHYED